MLYKKKMGMNGRIFFLLFFVMFFLSSVSAEIIFKQQPNEVYNVGDSVSVPVVVKTLSDFSGVFEMNLICSGKEINFYKNGVGLFAGEEREMETTLVLVPEIVGVIVGNCKIKAIFGEESILSDEFRVSDLIICDSKISQNSVKPERSILIEGSAAKETGSSANGFLDLNVISSDSIIILTKHGTINNGFFSVNLSIPKTMKAGKYVGQIKAYEKRLEKMTNNGDSSFEFLVEQIPSNLEIVFEDDGVKPGEELSARVVLHDQTGENIFEIVTVSIKDGSGNLIEEMEVSTDKEFGISIPSGEIPGNWKIFASFGFLSGERDFKIFENEEISVELLNETVLIKNIGNVVYDEDVLVKVGNKSLNLNVTLGLGEVQKYVLTAPDGSYDVQVRGGGKSKYEGMAILTGNVVGIEEISSGILGFVLHPVVWIFIIIMLGFFIFVFFKKGYRKTFIGRNSDKGEKKEKKKVEEIKEKSFLGAKHKAELSLSIKGERQDVCLVYLKIKNLKSFFNKGNFCEETFKKIINCADKKRVFVSEGQDGLFFILLPSFTKTFRNESTAISIANEVNLILEKHNKMFKQEIDYGISINYGSLIGKVKGGILYYMSLGSLVTLAKKISKFSDKRVLLSEDLRSRLSSNIKVVKETLDGLVFYSIKEIKERENHEKFLQSFLKRMDEKK